MLQHYLLCSIKFMVMKKWLVFAVVVLFMSLCIALRQAIYADRQWKLAMANVKAYSEELQDSKNKSTAYQFTIGQLESYQDSIVKALNKTREELKIKDKRLQSVQYVASAFERIDTFILQDTIFKESEFSMDTTISDKWYKLELGLKYPSTIAVKPEFRSEKHIVVSTKKETINPPKKFFLLRWFQKKMIVLRVDVVEKNPYTTEEVSKYIDIVK